MVLGAVESSLCYRFVAVEKRRLVQFTVTSIDCDTFDDNSQNFGDEIGRPSTTIKLPITARKLDRQTFKKPFLRPVLVQKTGHWSIDCVVKDLVHSNSASVKKNITDLFVFIGFLYFFCAFI